MVPSPAMPLAALLDLLRRPERPDMPAGWQTWPVAAEAHRVLSREAIAACPAYPDRFDGRGIVVCAGGAKYFTGAWVLVKQLRHLGCRLPVQFWHLPNEVDDKMRELVAPLGVACLDARAVEAAGPSYLDRPLRGGWELKAFAMVQCPYREVLLLDADNVPTLDPTTLFDAPEYRAHGSTFWPDFGRLAPDRSIWDLCEVPYRDEPEFETGQVLVDKAACWPELMLTTHYNDRSEFYYDHVHGDKETFHLAWRRLGRDYPLPRPIHALDATMCQHDLLGRRCFQHRNMDKWSLDGTNRRVDDFWYEDACLHFLAELRDRWSGRPFWTPPAPGALRDKVAGKRFLYRRIGHDERPMTLEPDGTIGEGAGGCERLWALDVVDGREALTLSGDHGPICHLTAEAGVWRGAWHHFERMPVELMPL